MKINRRALFVGLFAAAVAPPAFAVPDMRHSPALRELKWGDKTFRYDPVKMARKLRLNSEYGRLARRTFYIDVGSLPPDQAIAHMRKAMARYAA